MTVSLNLIASPSPNHDSREGQRIDMLVLHYTGMPTGAEALARLCDAEARVSAHYLIEEDGRIFALVDEAQRAWHAGVSCWRGHSNINARSIGIEIVNPGHEWGYRDFLPAQMEAVAALCREILSRHAIPARNVVGHSDVAPERKTDPGEKFDWPHLAAQGIGLWPEAQASDIRHQASAVQVQQRLADYGYGIAITGQWDTQTAQVTTAFQRHFCPERVDSAWDADCQAMLEALLSAASQAPEV